MRTPSFRVVALVSLLATIPTAHAWGAAGHEIVATIAQIHLPKPVLSVVCDILNPSSACPAAYRLASPSACRRPGSTSG